jgi:hypothetical protein
VHALHTLPAPSTTPAPAAHAKPLGPNYVNHSDSIFQDRILAPHSNPGNHQPPEEPIPLPPVPAAKQEVSNILCTLESTLIIPWNLYINTNKKNEITLELKKLSTTYFAKASTKDAAIEVNTEPPAANSSSKI